MTFAVEAQKSASERFLLVRVEPRKYLGTGALSSTNTYVFNTTLPRVDAVHIDGETTNVTSFSLSGGVLTVVSPTNLASSTYTVTADFHQFYCGTSLRDTTGNTAGIPEEIWEPYIENYPQWSQSMRNISDGVFSISNTQIDLISEDRLLQGYFGPDYSWSRAPVTVWACINTHNNARVIFTGEVVSAQVNTNKVSLSVLDTFQRLNQTADFGSKAQTRIYSGNSGMEYPNSADENMVIPLVIGESSPLFIKNAYRHLDCFGSPAAVMYTLSDGLRAIKVDPSNVAATSDVTFVAGRIWATDIKRLNFGSISKAYNFYTTRTVSGDISGGAPSDPTIWTRFIFIQSSNFNGEIGDYVPNITGSVSGWVCRKTPFVYAGETWNVAICCPEYNTFIEDSNSTSVPSNGLTSVSITNDSIPSIGVWIEGGDGVNYENVYVPLGLVPSQTYIKHDTRYLPIESVSVTPYTFAGQTINLVKFVLDPVTCKLTDNNGSNQLATANIKCRFSPAQSKTHGETLEYILTAAGMTTNSATFDAADSYLAANVSMCVPRFGDSDSPSYLDLAQSITTSTLGIVRANEDRECEYYILDDLSAEPSVGSRDVINILEGETSASIDYQDMATDFYFENESYKGIEAQSNSSGPTATVVRSQKKYLNRITKQKTIRHVLTNIYGRTSAMADYYSEPKVEYTFATSSDDLVSNIGDMLDMDNQVAASEDSSVSGMVVDLQSSGQKTKVIINELRGL